MAFEVELERRPLRPLVVAERARRGRVLAAALLALITLIAGRSKTGL
jgi:hypothetical protein